MAANSMTASSHTWISRLRSATAAGALLVCWVSGSAALAAQSPDVCSMSCCVQEGHCCCTPHHAYVKGQGPDGRDTIGQASLSSRCPSGCTTSQSVSRFSFTDSGATANRALRLGRSSIHTTDESITIPAANSGRACDPRGPPLSSHRAFQV